MLSDEIRKNARSIEITPSSRLCEIELVNGNKVIIYNTEHEEYGIIFDKTFVNDLDEKTWSIIDDIYEKNIGSRYSFRDYGKIIEFNEIFIDVLENNRRINPCSETTFYNHIIYTRFAQGYFNFRIEIAYKGNRFSAIGLNVSEDKQREVDLYILNNKTIPAIESIVVPELEGSFFHKCKDYYVRCEFRYTDNRADNYRVLRLDSNYYSLRDIDYINSDIWEDVEKSEVRVEVSC